MAIMKQHLSTAITFAKSTHLNSLANNAAIPLGTVDMSTNDYPNAKVHFTIDLATALDPGGTVDIYLLGSLDNSIWTDGINPNTTANQSTNLRNAVKVAELKADGDMNTQDLKYVCNDLSYIVGDLPPYWTLIPKNNSGSAFVSSGHTAQYYQTTYKGST
jgi:hypothetical protein